MLISVTKNTANFEDYILIDSETFRAENKGNQEILNKLQTLIDSGEHQYLTETSVISLPPYESSNPTQYDLVPIVEPKQNGAITELEHSAIKLVELAEIVSEPMSKAFVAKGAVRAIASLARRFR